MRPPILLFAVGVNLILLQLFMIREFSISVWSTELVILIITIAYFAGYSIGYFVSHRIPDAWIKYWLLFVTLAHLPLIVFVRILSGWLSRHGFDAAALPLIFGITALLLTSFYTVFLPRVISAAGATPRSMAWSYSVELAGSATGLVVVLLFGGWWFESLPILYMSSFIAIAWCLHYNRALVTAVAMLALSVLIVLSIVNQRSIEYFYGNYYRWVREPRLLHSVHSPYQRIDVVQHQRGRSLYLNGLEYFNSRQLEAFNFYLSELPARMLDKRNGDATRSALVVGSGSMSSLHHLAPYMDEIATVEIDRMVPDAGKKYFAEYNRLDEVKDKWTLVIDDAKHYLSTTEKRFDLVIIDVPAPWYVQTGLLFTREFYELVKARLRPGGIVSVYLTQTVSLKRTKPISSQILAALLQTFDDLVIVNAKKSPYGFVMAGNDLGFSATQAAVGIRQAHPKHDFKTLTARQARQIVRGVRPASFDNLNIVWDLNLWAIKK